MPINEDRVLPDELSYTWNPVHFVLGEKISLA